VIFLPMYLMELAFDKEMRFGLTLHHWVSISIVLWSLPVVYYTQNSLHSLRAVFALSLYMSTEGPVFLEMLFYQKQVYVPVMYYISAWYYALRLPIIFVFSMWTWWDLKDVVFNAVSNNSAAAYAFWIFIPICNLVLNATQFTTIVSLFGIAQNVQKRAKAAQLMASEEPAIVDEGTMISVDCSLYDAFTACCFDMGQCLSLEQWESYVKSLDTTFIIPQWTIEKVFLDMDVSKNNVVKFCGFSTLFSKYWFDNADFTSVVQIVLLKYMAEGTSDEVERGMYTQKHAVMMEGVARLLENDAHLRTASFGSRARSAVAELSISAA